ncbi:GIY-YIG nuclease family protein [Patescibacteria group bacterium]
MYYTYVLRSIKDKRYYIGSTENIGKRINRHNKGLVKSTKSRKPFKLVLYEQYSSRNEAYKREKEIKRMKGGIQFKKLIGLSNGHRKAGSRSAG